MEYLYCNPSLNGSLNKELSHFATIKGSKKMKETAVFVETEIFK